MGNRKIHALFVSSPATESDNQEWVDALCCDLDKIEDWKGTKYWEKVTCKRCLVHIEEMQKERKL